MKDALAFMITCPVLVRFAEITERDRPIDSRDDLAQEDVLGCPCEGVTPTNTAFRFDEAGTFQSEKDLLEVWLR
jgi:hypothetical protein